MATATHFSTVSLTPRKPPSKAVKAALAIVPGKGYSSEHPIVDTHQFSVVAHAAGVANSSSRAW